jgi:hypothetical protein
LSCLSSLHSCYNFYSEQVLDETNVITAAIFVSSKHNKPSTSIKLKGQINIL